MVSCNSWRSSAEKIAIVLPTRSEPERALGDDVFLHLARAAVDGGGAPIEVLIDDIGRTFRTNELTVPTCVQRRALVDHAVPTEGIYPGLQDRLRQLGSAQLQGSGTHQRWCAVGSGGSKLVGHERLDRGKPHLMLGEAPLERGVLGKRLAGLPRCLEQAADLAQIGLEL